MRAMRHPPRPTFNAPCSSAKRALVSERGRVWQDFSSKRHRAFLSAARGISQPLGCGAMNGDSKLDLGGVCHRQPRKLEVEGKGGGATRKRSRQDKTEGVSGYVRQENKAGFHRVVQGVCPCRKTPTFCWILESAFFCGLIGFFSSRSACSKRFVALSLSNSNTTIQIRAEDMNRLLFEVLARWVSGLIPGVALLHIMCKTKKPGEDRPPPDQMRYGVPCLHVLLLCWPLFATGRPSVYLVE